MTDLATSFGDVRDLAAAALRATTEDRGASVVLVAVVGELDATAENSLRLLADGSGHRAAVELERSADSAKAAADADPGAAEATRDAVTATRDAIGALTCELTPTHPHTRS